MDEDEGSADDHIGTGWLTVDEAEGARLAAADDFVLDRWFDVLSVQGAVTGQVCARARPPLDRGRSQGFAKLWRYYRSTLC
jgi:hypothetical protein